MSRPIVLSPATPSELLSYILSHHRYPTTVLVGSSKQDFLEALIEDVKQQLPNEDIPSQSPTHPLLRTPLMQMAISRHIRIIFIPSVTHLRTYLSVFTATDTKIPAPPASQPSLSTPLLLVYGFLELHRDASEWSAQGIGSSLAALVDGAARNGFRGAIVEIRDRGDLDGVLAEEIPLLNGSMMKGDGTWTGRTVQVRKVLGRWFEFEPQKEQ